MRTFQTANPLPLELLYDIGPFGEDGGAYMWEQRLHKHLTEMGRHLHGEWHRVDAWEIAGILEDVGFRIKQKRMI